MPMNLRLLAIPAVLVIAAGASLATLNQLPPTTEPIPPITVTPDPPTTKPREPITDEPRGYLTFTKDGDPPFLLHPSIYLHKGPAVKVSYEGFRLLDEQGQAWPVDPEIMAAVRAQGGTTFPENGFLYTRESVAGYIGFRTDEPGNYTLRYTYAGVDLTLPFSVTR